MKIVYYLYKFPKNLKVFMITSVLKKKMKELLTRGLRILLPTQETQV